MNNSREPQKQTRYAEDDYRYSGADNNDYRARNEYAAEEPIDTTFQATGADFDKLLYYNAPEKSFYGDRVATPVRTQALYADDRVARPTKTAYAEPSINVSKTIPEPRTVVSSEEDTMPTQRTMSYSKTATNYEYENFHAANETNEQKQYKISAKTKVLIAIYALVVLAVFTLIVLNTRLLSSMNAKIVDKQEALIELTEKNVELENALDYVSSPTEIERQAAEYGMVKE